MDLQKILDGIKDIFINETKYGFDKHIWEYTPDGKYQGDVFLFSMVEPTPIPTFYFVISPFDIISNKAAEHALVFRGGNNILNIDFGDYTAMRTGAMDTLLLQNLGIKSLADKKILMFGKGKTASWSQKFLHHAFADCPEIVIIDSKTDPQSYNISSYDIIICHTGTKSPLLSDPGKIKPGAIITSFISSAPAGEIPEIFYNPDLANIILDWDKNAKLALEIKSTPLYFGDLLTRKSKIDPSKRYTIARFLGTPLQNLAILKTLI